MASSVAGKDAASSKKKARRSSRQGESPVPCHYGPVLCTSVAALVQAYLAVDAPGAGPTQPPGNSSGGSDGNGSQVASGTCSLYMSESRFDPIKLRFGGKSKPVCSAARSADLSTDGVAGIKGAHLNFGPGARVVATSEAMNEDLHCRCVFVLLLCDSPSDVSRDTSISLSSSPTQGGEDARPASQTAQPRRRRVDTVHLITLSPDDLFLAISIDSFPVVVTSPESVKYGGQDYSDRRHARATVADDALPRAFEVLDGPVVVHRPAAKPGESWRSLEVFCPAGVVARGGLEPMRTWEGQLLVAPPLGDGSGDDAGGCVGGNRSAAFRLDLAAASRAKDHLGVASQGDIRSRSKNRTLSNYGDAIGKLLVCPARSSSAAAAEDDLSGCRLIGGHWRDPDCDGGSCVGINAGSGAVLAVPATSHASAAFRGNDKASQSPPLKWASLSFDWDGRGSLAPWRGTPSNCRDSLACLCRAPAMDSGVVSLARETPTEAEMPMGLSVKPSPPAVYVGVANATDGVQPSGGSVMELQGGGALSCSRSLPAPPRTVMTAAVDDARGVLVVLLADAAGTAMLLARDGCELPIVEEYRGVAFAHAGDFLGNGREQVAFFPMASSAIMASGGGATAIGGGSVSGALRRASVPAPAKPGAGAYEQLPLKTLVKRALVTDCSCVWGNGRRDDLAALPGAGPIQVGGGLSNGAGIGDGATFSGGSSAGPSSDMVKGRKRPRTEADYNRDAENRGGLDGASALRQGCVSASSLSGDNHRLARLSTVVGVLRRRVLAEEARLLKLRQARYGKAAALEAAELALVARVEGGAKSNSKGVEEGDNKMHLMSYARSFYDGQTGAGDDGVNPPSWVDEGLGNASHAPLRCKVARVRFHAPSHTLCLDACVNNPPETTNGDEEDSSVTDLVATDVAISVACASGRLTTRSAVCRRLCPGEHATIRACAEVPPYIQAGDIATALYASCTWCSNSSEAAAADAGVGGRESFHPPSRHCAIFARILMSPQDMLGVGPLASSGGVSPYPTREESDAQTFSTLFPGASCSGSGGSNSSGGNFPLTALSSSSRNLGTFDIGTRLDLLVRSDDPGTSLAVLPQALRSLSASAASLPEPWAGGATVYVEGCSERAAACTLRASDALGAPEVLLRVALGALPDGARASADHASEQGMALLEAATTALREEMVALEWVARVRRRSGGDKDVGNARGVSANEGVGVMSLSAALERYRAAQMVSDLVASRLIGRIIAAQGGDGDVLSGPRGGRRLL